MDKLAAVWSVVKGVIERHVVPFLVYFLVIILLQHMLVDTLTSDVKVSLSLAQQIATKTAGFYLAIYLLAHLLWSFFIPSRWLLACLVIGLLANSFELAMLLVAAVEVGRLLLHKSRQSEKLRDFWAARSDRVQSTMILLLALVAGAVLLWAGWVAS